MCLRSFFKLIAIFLLLMLQPNSGCYHGWTPQEGDVGGLGDVLTIHMPFQNGYTAQCTQGVNGSHSHRGEATRNDLDFDTPNARNDLVFAPVSGTAYVHDDPNDGFGRHVNIALGDGTYIILGHLEQIFVRNGTEVGLSQVIAFEGTTGNSDGDHVHIGRHRGDPAIGDGVSIGELAIIAQDTTTGEVAARVVSEYVCALSGGRTYKSQLPDVRSHPEGTLVKSPYGADVYILGDARRHAFEDEAVFWSHNRNFADVVLVSDDELNCYDEGGAIITQTQIRGAYDGTATWLLVGTETDSLRWRQELNPVAWSQVLASWGVHASTESELEQEPGVITDYPRRSGFVPWRDGALVREETPSDVYLVAGGLAFPIVDWDVLLRLGLSSQTVHVIPDSSLLSTVANVGNCVTDQFCLDHAFAESCGASLFGNFATQTIPPEVEEDSEVDTTDEVDTTNEEEPVDDSPVPPPDVQAPLTLEWQTPYGVQASRITLSGVYAPQGAEQWWTTLANVTNADRITYTHPGMESGDYLRFSVEYVVGGSTSWSCLAPFPPGRVQGLAAATWVGKTLPFVAAADPMSPGCGLVIEIP